MNLPDPIFVILILYIILGPAIAFHYSNNDREKKTVYAWIVWFVVWGVLWADHFW